MINNQSLTSLTNAIQYNCNISDARDHGVYSMCTMVLKLRNMYKWEKNIEPWAEPEPADLLEWIDAKENTWEKIAGNSFVNLGVNGKEYSPAELSSINSLLSNKLIYGAGYGRSMKAVFFLAELLETRLIEDCQVYILGKEKAKEMASPFAMTQDGDVFIRKESLRYFIWDHIQELRDSKRSGFRFILNHYDLLTEEKLDAGKLKSRLNTIVDEELDLFVYHEIGEIKETGFDSMALQTILFHFPGSVIELVCRSIKDVLADTNEHGLLTYCIEQQKNSSLGLYVGLLDGLRKELFPEIGEGWTLFEKNHDWSVIASARDAGRKRLLELGTKISELAGLLSEEGKEDIEHRFDREILEPLGLEGRTVKK